MGQKQTSINWLEYNYPPLIKLMHFRPSQLPQEKKSLVMMLFSVHIGILIATFLSFVGNCIEGGLGILYSILFIIIFNPIVLFLFYRAYMGVCKDKGKITLFIYISPVIILLEIVVSIIDFLGFNGFIRVNLLYTTDQAGAATVALIADILYMLIAIFSSYLYYRVFRQKSILTKALIP